MHWPLPHPPSMQNVFPAYVAVHSPPPHSSLATLTQVLQNIALGAHHWQMSLPVASRPASVDQVKAAGANALQHVLACMGLSVRE